jgi:hypothetical protein
MAVAPHFTNLTNKFTRFRLILGERGVKSSQERGGRQRHFPIGCGDPSNLGRRMSVNDKLIARIGLGAAALIFVASLGILVVQASHNNGVPIHSLQPAQIEPAQTVAPSGQADAQQHEAVSVGS